MSKVFSVARLAASNGSILPGGYGARLLKCRATCMARAADAALPRVSQNRSKGERWTSSLCSSLARGHHTLFPQVIVIAGPTAVGKTSLSLALAERLDGEIISADSIQVYKGLDVGSDKVSILSSIAKPSDASHGV